MNVPAVEELTGKENKITVTNDKERLSKEEVERLAAEGKTTRQRTKLRKIRLKLRIECSSHYCFSRKNSINEEKQKEHIPEHDKKKLTENLEETLKWLDDILN